MNDKSTQLNFIKKARILGTIIITTILNYSTVWCTYSYLLVLLHNLIQLKFLAHAVKVLLALGRRLLGQAGRDFGPVVAVSAQAEPQQLHLGVGPGRSHLMRLFLGLAGVGAGTVRFQLADPLVDPPEAGDADLLGALGYF